MASLREGNRKLVIDALRERGVASRAELARITDLSRSTVSTIVSDLLDTGLASERDGQPDGETHAGRPPVMVSLNGSAGLAVGIDFGHRHLRVAVSDLSHTVLAETWREIDVDHSADQGLDTAVEFVDEVLAEAGADRGRVIGVGMGLPATDRSRDRRRPGDLDPPGLGRRRRRGGGQRPARAPGRGRQRRQPRRARRARLGRRQGQVRGRLHQGLVRDRRRSDLRRPAPARCRRDGRRDRPHADRRAAGRFADAATAAASRRSRRPGRSPRCSAPAAPRRSRRRGCSSCAPPATRRPSG